jgi:hypothetical protein
MEMAHIKSLPDLHELQEQPALQEGILSVLRPSPAYGSIIRVKTIW